VDQASDDAGEILDGGGGCVGHGVSYQN
jgi:hypothetical protein